MALASARNSISRRFDTAQRVFTRQSRPFPEQKVSQIAFQTLRLISCLIELNLIVIEFNSNLFFFKCGKLQNLNENSALDRPLNEIFFKKFN